MTIPKSATILLTFHHLKGGQQILSPMQGYLAKTVAQMLDGSQLCTYGSLGQFKIVKIKFLKAVLTVLHCISNAATALHLKVGFMSTEAHAGMFMIPLFT